MGLGFGILDGNFTAGLLQTSWYYLDTTLWTQTQMALNSWKMIPPKEAFTRCLNPSQRSFHTMPQWSYICLAYFCPEVYRLISCPKMILDEFMSVMKCHTQTSTTPGLKCTVKECCNRRCSEEVSSWELVDWWMWAIGKISSKRPYEPSWWSLILELDC